MCLDLLRFWQVYACRSGLVLIVVVDDLVANIYALIADINARASDKFLHIVLRFAAKRTT
jgi:hypothetical protein